MGSKTINRKHRVGCPTLRLQDAASRSRARVAAGGVQVEAAVVRRCCDRRGDVCEGAQTHCKRCGLSLLPFVHTRVAPNCVQH